MTYAIWRSLLRNCCALALGLLSLAAGAVAPQLETIDGNPLTIRVGDDASFQILNAQIPGVGQIYPSDALETADLGWFVRAGGALYSPNFEEHPDGTATSGLGEYIAYTTESISEVAGTGTRENPWQVSVTGRLGELGLKYALQISYVQFDTYYTNIFSVSNEGAAPQEVRIFLGGDIYLADDDAGLPYREGASGSPGGSDCGETPSYYILMIPQSPADAHSATSYSNIWRQIGQVGQLDNTVATGCVDNGAALQWNRTIAAGATTVVQAAMSFGDIPDIAQFNITDVTPDTGKVGTTVAVTITGIGFGENSVFEFGDDIAIQNLVIVNDTTATATLAIGAGAAVGPRDVSGRQQVEGAGATLRNGFTVLPADATNAGLLQFGAATYSVDEDDGSVTVTVTRTAGSDGEASVRYEVADGTALRPGDYADAGGLLVWAAGDAAPKTFTVAIVDDSLVENSETFTVALSNVTGAALGAVTTTTVTIVDNDVSIPPPQGDGTLKSGGGALGGGLLSLLALAAAGRRRALRLLPVLLLGLGAAAPASAETWYAGLRAGIAEAGIGGGELGRELGERGHDVSVDLDDRDIGGTLYAGYWLSPRAAIELGYLNLGEYDARLSGDLSNGQAIADDAASIFQGSGDGVSAALRLRIPVAGPLAVGARMGGYWWTSETEVRTPEGRYSADDDGFGILVGLSLDVTLAQRLRLGIGSELLRSSHESAQQQHTLQVEFGF